MEIADRTVLVTGANRGIGRAIVDALLARRVHKIYAGARRIDSLPDFGDPRVAAVELDITDSAQVAAAVAQAGDVDLLINNAGVATFADISDADEESLRRDVEVNYFGTLNVIRQFLPTLVKQRDAAIVNLVTIAAFVNFPSLGGYSASKAALFSASQGLRIDLAKRGIAVHTVNPGPIDTEMAKDLDMDKTSAQETAQNIVAALAAGEADIFPDQASRQMFETWRGNYRDLERAVSDMHHAA